MTDDRLRIGVPAFAVRLSLPRSGSGIQPRVEAWRNPGVSKDLITLRYSVSHLPNVQNY